MIIEHDAILHQKRADMLAPRLIRIDLRPLADGNTLLVSPSGRRYQVAADPATIHQVLQKCDGRTPLAEIISQCEESSSAGIADVLQTLLQDGCLSDTMPGIDDEDWMRFQSETLRPDALGATHIVILGDDALITLVREQHFGERFASLQCTTFDTLPDILASCGEKVILVVLKTSFEKDFLVQLNDFCVDRQLPWTQFHIEQGHGWLGPSIVPGHTPDYDDVLGRRLCAADYAHIFDALVSPALFQETYGSYLPPRSELVWMLAFLFVDIERWVTGAACRTLWAEVQADPVQLTFTPHPILPLPDKHLQGEGIQGDSRMLIDAHCGLILDVREIEHHPSIPTNLTTAQTIVADMSRLYPWANNTICGGSAFGNMRSARNAAIGEAAERYCGNCVDGSKIILASYEDLLTRGDYAIDPEQIVNYSDAQYTMPGFPFVKFTRDLPVHWVQGRSLTMDRPAWIPASLVYVNWYTGQYANDPPTNYLYYPGIAAGQTLETALSSAVEEIIERDATMIWWMNRQPLPAVVLNNELASLWEGTPTKMGQRGWIIYLENEFDVPVMAGVVENVAEHFFNIGFAARPTPVQAALKAWTEGLTLQEGSRDLLLPHGLYREAAANGMLNSSYMKPWRADQKYLQSYRPDFHDVNDLMCQQQIFLDPDAREIVRPWVDVATTRSLAELPSLPDRLISTYQKRVEQRGYEIFYADITTPDVAYSGLKVVRAIIPGLVPNFPAAFPFLGKGRIQRAAVERGWRNEPLSEEDLNYFPLPHA